MHVIYVNNFSHVNTQCIMYNSYILKLIHVWSVIWYVSYLLLSFPIKFGIVWQALPTFFHPRLLSSLFKVCTNFVGNPNSHLFKHFSVATRWRVFFFTLIVRLTHSSSSHVDVAWGFCREGRSWITKWWNRWNFGRTLQSRFPSSKARVASERYSLMKSSPMTFLWCCW